MSRLRRALLAVGTTVGAASLTVLPLGMGSIWVGPAAAAPGDASATIPFSCTVALGPTVFPAYTWNPTFTVSAVRPEGSVLTSVTAASTDMAPASPVPVDYDEIQTLGLVIDGKAVTLSGSGKVKNNVGSAPFALPSSVGTVVSGSADVSVSVTSFVFKFPSANMTGTCSPTGATALGTMTIKTGVVPTPTIVPTTTASATAKPRAVTSSSSAVETAASVSKAGTAAKGSATFSCRLGPPFASSTFTYPTAISVSAGRASQTSAEVSLSGKLDSMPGIIPVPLDAVGMRVHLKGTIDGKAFDLKGSNSLTLAVKEKIPVPGVSGSASTSATNPAVKITGFDFDTDESGGIAVAGTCTLASPVTLSKMTVGLGKSAVQAAGGGAGSGGTGGTSSAGTLPKTGASDLGLLVAWGLGLIAIGSSGLVLIRRVR